MGSYYRISRFSTVARTDEDLAMSMAKLTIYTNNALLCAAAFAMQIESESDDRGQQFVDLMVSNPDAQRWDYDGIRYSVVKLDR